MIHFLVKAFTELEHANRFLQGELYARRLSWFKKLESDEGRGDEYEAAIMPQRENLIITLATHNMVTGEVEEFTIPSEDLAAPPILQPEHFDHINVFCMYAAHSGDFKEVSEDNIQDYRRQLELPKECLRLGRYAVAIIDNPEFLRRVKIGAERQGFKIYRGLVRFYDPEVGTPLAPLDLGVVFTKRKKYAHQGEYRFAIDTGSSGCEPITLDIGRIDDIAVRLETAEINRQLSIRLGSPRGVF